MGGIEVTVSGKGTVSKNTEESYSSKITFTQTEVNASTDNLFFQYKKDDTYNSQNDTVTITAKAVNAPAGVCESAVSKSAVGGGGGSSGGGSSSGGGGGGGSSGGGGGGYILKKIPRQKTDKIVSGGGVAPFSDVSSSSSNFKAIQWAKENGIVKGYADGTFKPNQPINRVEFLKVIIEANKVEEGNYMFAEPGFTDVDKSQWYWPYIQAGYTLTVFEGDSGKNTARPADTVNRAEVLKMLFELQSVSEKDKVKVSACNIKYADVKGQDWFYKYVCKSDKYDLIDIAGTYFNPGKLSTRGEVTEVLYRLDKQLND